MLERVERQEALEKACAIRFAIREADYTVVVQVLLFLHSLSHVINFYKPSVIVSELELVFFIIAEITLLDF